MPRIKITIISIFVLFSFTLDAQSNDLQINVSYNQELVKPIDPYWQQDGNYYGHYRNRKGIVMGVQKTAQTKFPWLNYFYGAGVKIDGFVGRHVTLIEPLEMVTFDQDTFPQSFTDVDHWTRIKPELTFGLQAKLGDFSLGLGATANYAIFSKVKREYWLYKSILFKNEFLGSEVVDPPFQFTPWDIDLFLHIQKPINDQLRLNLSFRKGMLTDKDYDSGFWNKTYSFQVGLGYVLSKS